MKTGQRTLMLAFGLADDATARLLARGVPPALLPSRDEVLMAVWPLARRLVKSKKLARNCEKAHQIGVRHSAEVQARQAEMLDALVAMWARAGDECRPVTWERLARFEPGQWRVALEPAIPTREAA